MSGQIHHIIDACSQGQLFLFPSVGETITEGDTAFSVFNGVSPPIQAMLQLDEQQN